MTSPMRARICFLLFGAVFVGQACGGTRAGTKLDAADGSGGMGTGDVGTGGPGTGSGGSVPIGTGGTKVGAGGSVGTGGSVSSGGAPSGTGGAMTGTMTGGTVATGGTPTSASGSGGTFGTGGSRSTGGSGGSPSGDAGTTACTCAGGTTTWDCFCSIHSCSLTLSYYQPDGGGTGPYSTLEEYANCNLVVVSKTTNLAGGVWVFDRTTGRLVGERYESDVPDACPFAPDGSANRTLSAGQFPDASCVRSRCVSGSFPSRTNCPDGGI